jgi:transcriptional antiterminator RfaH
LPQVPHTSLIRGRRFTSQIPLFASYVFVFADDHDRIQTLSTQRVIQMLPAPDRAEVTSDLKNIQSLIAANAPLTLESRLQPGRKVRVKNGSLMGMEGVIVARRGCDRLLVSVAFLQQGVSIEISDFQVEPLS